MPVPELSFGWGEAALAFAVLAAAAFLVTWVVTDLLRIPRGPYIAILSVVVVLLGAGYLAWSGTGVAGLVTTNWARGVVAGIIVAAITTPLIRRLPAGERPRGSRVGGLLLWDGAVYGVAEAVLLATLPVLVVWQGATAVGSTDDPWGKGLWGAIAIAGSLVVILVHHLGYEEFRERAVRKKLAGALVTCGVQALAFLLTASVWAPVVAHIALHGELIVRGVELPPLKAPAEGSALGRLGQPRPRVASRAGR